MAAVIDPRPAWLYGQEPNTGDSRPVDPCDFGSWRVLAQIEDLAQNHAVTVRDTAEAVALARVASDHLAAPAYIGCEDRWTVSMLPTERYLCRVLPTAAVAVKAALVGEMVAEGCSQAEAEATVDHLAAGGPR